MHVLRTVAVVAVSSLALAACGGSDEAQPSEAAPSSAAESSPAEPSPTAEDTSADDEYEIIDVTGESKDVGFDVMDFSTDNNFTPPKDQAEFEAKVKYDKSLRPGSKAGYRVEGDKWFICVTHYEGEEPVSWAIFDAQSGLAEGDVGEPTESFCP